MTVKAIETRYAGCRFRSRLEARWAVFFDHLGIRWEYEPEGFEVSCRLTLTGGYDDHFWYLPDFWLPDLGVWVEVKGALTGDEGLRLLDAAASLSSNDGGGCHDSGGHDLVVLGPISAEPRIGWRLHMHKGDLLIERWALKRDDCIGANHYPVAVDYGLSSLWMPPEESASTLLRGAATYDPKLKRALTAARCARFEHGEHG